MSARTTAGFEVPTRYALLTDGETVELRTPTKADLAAVLALHEGMSPASKYLRFFGVSKLAPALAANRQCEADGVRRVALIAVLGGEVIGAAEYDLTDEPGSAEIAFAVADAHQHRGVGTLLLEHLASLARARGLTTFVAETLLDNTLMQRVFADAGLSVSLGAPPAEGWGSSVGDGVVAVRAGLEADERYLQAVAARERAADVPSLRPIFAPRTVAVIGAGRRPGTVGRAILENIRAGGFTGTLYAVNPHAGQVADVPSYPAVAALPVVPDLCVLAVPAHAVARAAEECGQAGVRGLVTVTAGLTRADGDALLDACRRHGMRLVGPNCLGVAVPGSGVELNATFAAGAPAPGSAGLIVQSGGVGIALLDHLARLGIGVSSFASVGDKYDVSSNDMLQWWASDGITRLAILHLESFGNARKFARVARTVSRTLPVLTVAAGRSEAGSRAAASHTAAAATPAVTRQALFGQAGVIAAESLAELLDVAALLACQPLPHGPRVAILSNAGGVAVLAADALVEAGLRVDPLGDEARERLAALLPEGAVTTNPIDTTAAVPDASFHAALAAVAAEDEVDAVVALVAPTALGRLDTGLNAATDRHGKPFLAVRVNQPATVEILHDEAGNRFPSYADAASAARALGHAHQRARWLLRPVGRLPHRDGIDARQAALLVEDFLATHPDGGWLPPDACAALLECYRIPVVPTRLVHSEDAAAAIANGMNGPAVLKAYWPDLVHKSDEHAVLLDLHGEQAVRAAYRDLATRFADRLTGAVVQPMATPGTELLLGLTNDGVFGPLIVVGLGGTTTDVLGEHIARLTPLTDLDAHEMITTAPFARLLTGFRGHPAADIPAIEHALTHLALLADDLPQVAEVDLNPVMSTPDGVVAVDARVRVVPREAVDPYLRRLR